MYCPYCGKIQRVKTFDGLIMVLSLLTGMIIIYILYCVVNTSWICTGCNRRIYKMKDSVNDDSQQKQEEDRRMEMERMAAAAENLTELICYEPWTSCNEATKN